MSDALDDAIRRLARDVAAAGMGRRLVEVVLSPLAMSDLVMASGGGVVSDGKGKHLPLVASVDDEYTVVRVRREPA